LEKAIDKLYLFGCLFEGQRNYVSLVIAVDLLEVCHPKNYNIGLLAYSPLGSGMLSGKYLDANSEAAKKGRLNLFPGYMERYKNSLSRVCYNLNVSIDCNG
jgi:aryl-alcohol dehydrogenase-like predicted oxidoreductase